MAIAGAGPAGLAAADTLNLAGHRVTVFDEARHPGGILRYGIPDYRLPSRILDRDVQRILADAPHARR